MAPDSRKTWATPVFIRHAGAEVRLVGFFDRKDVPFLCDGRFGSRANLSSARTNARSGSGRTSPLRSSAACEESLPFPARRWACAYDFPPAVSRIAHGSELAVARGRIGAEQLPPRRRKTTADQEMAAKAASVAARFASGSRVGFIAKLRY